MLLKMIFSEFHDVQLQHFSGVVDMFKGTWRIYSAFCLPKLINIALFLTELFKK